MRKKRNDANTTSYFDYTLLFLILFLLVFGLVMLYSVSAYEGQSTFGDATYYLRHQLRNMAIGFVGMIVAAAFPYRFWKTKVLSRMAFWGATLLCVAVVFVGSDAYGSTRWLSIGPIQFQPSEMAKIGVIIYMAAVLCKMPKQIKKGESLIGILARLIVPLAFIAYSDLSTAIIIAGIAFFMMFVASPRYSHFIVLAVAGIGAIALFIVFAGYRSTRIMAWLNPEEYSASAYQTLQGLYAIGSGGLFGKGLGGSIQKLGYVPEAQNDFIFTIICEELGLFGGICVIVLFALLIWRFMVVANNARDLFGALLVVGVMAHISLQVILNLAVVTNSIPNTGVTLPFISYGGSSMIFLMTEMGLVLGVSRGIRLEVVESASVSDRHRRLHTPITEERKTDLQGRIGQKRKRAASR